MPLRKYFNVIDENGRELPAVEYWAAGIHDDASVFEVVPLRRFVKLLGTGDHLQPLADGVFTAQSGRRYLQTVPRA